MNAIAIPIPGESTKYDEVPVVFVQSPRNQPLTLTIRYIANTIDPQGSVTYGEIIFHGVLEYRWIVSDVEYEDFAEHEGDYTFGLIQIEDSQYVERMAAKGPWRDFPNERFGGVIKEQDVKHYRIAFDDYGRFDVIALGVRVQTG